MVIGRRIMSTQTKPSRIMHNDDKLDQIKLYQLYHTSKGETIHSMYRNHDYFGDDSVHDTWRLLTIQTI
jgi:hypothetical protein